MKEWKILRKKAEDNSTKRFSGWGGKSEDSDNQWFINRGKRQISSKAVEISDKWVTNSGLSIKKEYGNECAGK